jgi:predicted acetyltransferase
MIAQHFADCAAKAAPLSILGASEMVIYGRFGYGVSGAAVRLTIPRGADLRDVPGSDQLTVRVETATLEAHGALVAEIERQVADGPGARPGWTPQVPPSAPQWRFFNAPFDAATQEAKRIVIVAREGRPTGFALFTRDGKWDGGQPNGTVSVRECAAVDGPSLRALWAELTNLDLTSRVTTPLLTIDDPLMTLLVDWRACSPRYEDHQHVRIIDLPAALEARRYAAPVDVVLEVTDDLLPANAGLWRLRGGPDGAQVTTLTAADADHGDVALDIHELGALYLGGGSVSGPAAVGLIRENTPGALASVDAAFHGFLQPGSPHHF